ncbi:hypothetical protein Q8A67_001493 [Cirrhinus molitorella]|uniref:Uncharacterized protein n=1 Tax=Cirrhinus molitorella TaxID=172907 RepID=A0AA88QRJ9_9TELE|nr:hypothetical protein Q8A67_001493 [Cirrhinus molitorella]
MYNISVSCAEIQTVVGFVYVILPVILNHTNNPDCEQSWFSEDGSLIADPSDPQRLIDPVISVSSDHLVTSRCVNLNHEIICDSADGFRYQTIFRVFNGTDSIIGSTQTPESNQLWWFSVLIFVVLAVLCFLLRKMIFRCFQGIFQRSGPENSKASNCSDSKLRCSECSISPALRIQMKVRSDDPHAVQESEQLKAPEIKVESTSYHSSYLLELNEAPSQFPEPSPSLIRNIHLL